MAASLHAVKPWFQRLLRPLVGRLAACGATPNQLTIGAALLSAAGGAAVAVQPQARWPLLALPVVLLARMALNALDGMLAREHGLESRLGAVLNEVGDAVSDATLYLPLALVPGIEPAAVVAVVVLAVVAELAGVAAVLAGVPRRHDGPMGKSDRALWLGALALAVGSGIDPAGWAQPALWAIAALLGVTIVHRVRGALAQAA